MVKLYNYEQFKFDYDQIRNKNIVIWCCSISGLYMYKELCNEGLHVVGFADSSKLEQKGITFAGLPVFTFAELKSMKELVICIATYNVNFQKQILEFTDKIGGG